MENLKKFEKIYIEISNICNLKCSFCPQDEIKKRVLMDKNLFEHTISKIKPYTDDVTFHILGEPLLHPKLQDYLDICGREEIKVHITTNGIAVEKFHILKSSKAIKQINFSLHSYSANVFKISIEEYINPILLFCDSFESSMPYINFRFWDKSSSESKNSSEVVARIENFFDINLAEFIKRGDRRSKKIKNKIYLHLDSRFEFPSMHSPFISEVGRCHALQSHIAINAKGEVLPCCLDYQGNTVLGDIRAELLEDILSSQKAINMIEGFKQNRLIQPLCQRCSYIKRFL